jgi:hypothetical protein
MAGINSREIHDTVRGLIDNITMDPDPAARLHHYGYLADLWKALVLPARDEAAYDARLLYPIRDLARAVEMDEHQVIHYVRRHRARTGLPPVGKRSRDLSAAVDLRGLVGRTEQRQSRTAASTPPTS